MNTNQLLLECFCFPLECNRGRKVTEKAIKKGIVPSLYTEHNKATRFFKGYLKYVFSESHLACEPRPASKLSIWGIS